VRCSVIVPIRDRAALLPRLFDAIDATGPAAHGAELLVADNGSADATPDILAERVRAAPYPATALRVREPGANAARNAAAALASGDVLVFLDSDCVPAPGHLATLTAVLAAHPAQYGGGPVPSPDAPPARAGRTVRIAPGRLVPPGTVNGGNMFALRAAFRALGGFRTDIGPGMPVAFSDAEFATRASLAGYEGVWAEALAVVHAPDDTPGDAVRARWDAGRGAYLAELLSAGRARAWTLWQRMDAHDSAADPGGRPARLAREFAGAADHLARLAAGGGPRFAVPEAELLARSAVRRN